jgi:HD superfamily phosphodiesterase
MRIPLSKICNFINYMCNNYKIDESHGLKHALDVYKHCINNVATESARFPFLLDQQPVIYTAALLHDTCDKKYMKESEGIEKIKEFLITTQNYNNNERDVIIEIIQTMSYSKVKSNGFPELGEYQLAYHIVREADLLAAYDFDRGLIYTMNNYKVDYKTAFTMAKELYEKRMAKHVDDGLITTKYGVKEAEKLLSENMKHIESIESILQYDL